MSGNLSEPKFERIFSSLPNSVQAALVAFAEHVADIQSDYVICMARKCAKLLDLLNLADLPGLRRPMFYHYILQQDITWLKGKSVTLIDDTLILGTTLRNATQKLQSAGARVSTVVFARDKDNWQKKLIQPEQAVIDFSAEDILSFCSWQVQAFARWGIPYLSDFPVGDPMHLPQEKFERMLKNGHWETHRVSNFDKKDGMQDGISAYSSIPVDGTSNMYLEKFLGNEIHALCNIVKVRIYTKKMENDHVRIKLIPMITLHPLSIHTIKELFENIIAWFEYSLNKKFTSIRENIHEAEAKLRVVQYMMSALLGIVYTKNFALLEPPHTLSYSSTERNRLFGKLVGLEIEECLGCFVDMHEQIKKIGDVSKKIESCELPAVALRARDECADVVNKIYKSISTDYPSQSQAADELFISVDNEQNTPPPISIMYLMEKIFLHFYEKYELEARKEVKKECEWAQLEKRDVNLSEKRTPNLDRLGYGFDWDSIATQILGTQGISDSPIRKLRLSILLDKLVDAGIAVPILCQKDEVVFRAYRHGEGVKFAEDEYSYAYNAMVYLFQHSNLPAIKKTALEKFLVSFLRIGIEAKLLEKRVPGRSFPGQSAQVGFYLHGAVTHMPEEIQPIADNNRIWLSSILEREGFLALSSDVGGYTLGKEPSSISASLNKSTLTSAKELGMVFGAALNKKLGRRRLSLDDLILLASCCSKRDTAMALAAELYIVNGDLLWFADNHQDVQKLAKAHRRMIRIATAIKSAKLKYSKHGSYKQIVEKMRSAVVASSPNLEISATRITDYLFDIANSDKFTDETFHPLVEKCWRHIVELAKFSHQFVLLAESGYSNKNLAKFSGAVKAKELSESYISLISLKDEIKETLPDIIIEDNVRSSSGIGIGDGERLRQICRQACAAAMEDYRHIIAQYNKYGLRVKSTSYRYVLFYDIINSTCKKLTHPRTDIDNMEQDVARFLTEINGTLGNFVQDCNDLFNTKAFCVNGDLYSTDDSKHLLMDGEHEDAAKALRQAMNIVLNLARVHEIRVRIILSTTNFAGDCASVVDGSFGSNGRSFWAGFNKAVKNKLREMEARADSGASFVFLCDELSPMSNFFFSDDEWQHHEATDSIFLTGSYSFKSEIEYTYATANTAPSGKWDVHG